MFFIDNSIDFYRFFCWFLGFFQWKIIINTTMYHSLWWWWKRRCFIIEHGDHYGCFNYGFQLWVFLKMHIFNPHNSSRQSTMESFSHPIKHAWASLWCFLLNDDEKRYHIQKSVDCNTFSLFWTVFFPFVPWNKKIR